ncbi:MAG: hypothetical protein V3R84_02570 [Acidimicrobiia bacterium]
MTALRVLLVILVLAILVVAALPLLVVVDLVSGGDGYGLCASGLTSCRTSYFDGPELAAFIALVTFVLIAAIRVVQVAMMRLSAGRSRRLSGPLSPPRASAPRR